MCSFVLGGKVHVGNMQVWKSQNILKPLNICPHLDILHYMQLSQEFIGTVTIKSDLSHLSHDLMRQTDKSLFRGFAGCFYSHKHKL